MSFWKWMWIWILWGDGEAINKSQVKGKMKGRREQGGEIGILRLKKCNLWPHLVECSSQLPCSCQPVPGTHPPLWS
jgi:hypothetical protein